MAFTVPNIAGLTYPAQAQIHQMDLDIVVAGLYKTGVVGAGDFTSSLPGAMAIGIGAGTQMLAGVVTKIGGTGSVTAIADGTNPRFALIYLTSAGVATITHGTAAANPSKPALPANATPLFEVYIPAATTTILAGMIVDKRVVLTTPPTLQAIGRIDIFGHSLMAEGGTGSSPIGLDAGSMHKLASLFPARFRNMAWGAAVAMVPGLPTTAQSGVGNRLAGWGYIMYQNPNHSRTPTYDSSGNAVALSANGTGLNAKLTAGIASGLAAGTSIAVDSSLGWVVNRPVLLRQAGGSQLDEINYLAASADGTHIALALPTVNAYSNGDAVVSVPDFYSCERQLALLEYDLNDLAWMGITTWNSTFIEVYRAIVAWLRSAAFWGVDTKLMRQISGTWTAAAVADGFGAGSDPLIPTASARELTATATASLAIDIPSNFEAGAAIALFFKTKANGDGAVWTYNADGGSNSTKETRNINGFYYNSGTGTRTANGVNMPSCVVIRGLAAGKHVINLSVATATIQGTATFMGWSIIPPDLPPLVIELPNRLLSYAGLYAAPLYVPVDADVATMSTAIKALIAEFTPTDGTMLTLDREPIINKQAKYFGSDQGHNNDNGHSEISIGIANLLMSSNITARSLLRCSPGTQRGWYPIGGTGDGAAQPNFNTNWQNQSSGTPAGYYKDIGTGRVDLRGQIFCSSITQGANTVIFTLPVSHRPAYQQTFTIALQGGPGILTINTNGDVAVAGAEGSFAVDGFVSLEGVSFYAEQ